MPVGLDHHPYDREYEGEPEPWVAELEGVRHVDGQGHSGDYPEADDHPDSTAFATTSRQVQGQHQVEQDKCSADDRDTAPRYVAGQRINESSRGSNYQGRNDPAEPSWPIPIGATEHARYAGALVVFVLVAGASTIVELARRSTPVIERKVSVIALLACFDGSVAAFRCTAAAPGFEPAGGAAAIPSAAVPVVALFSGLEIAVAACAALRRTAGVAPISPGCVAIIALFPSIDEAITALSGRGRSAIENVPRVLVRRLDRRLPDDTTRLSGAGLVTQATIT